MKQAITSVVFILTIVLKGFSITDDFYFKQISLEEGLTQSRVQCILRDKDGIVWIGTKQGLNSYDQFDLKTYTHNKADTTSLPGNYIYFLTEDEYGTLYVSTNKGVALYDRSANTFRTLKYKGKFFIASSFYNTEDKIIFGGANQTLHSYSPTTGVIKPFIMNPSDGQSGRITKLCHWKDSLLLAVVHQNGIWICDMATKSMRPFPYYAEKKVHTLFVDSQQRIWISIYNEGVLCYDVNGTLVYQLNTHNSDLSNDIVFDFLEKDNLLWLATDGGGISLLDTGTNKIRVLKHTYESHKLLPYNSIYCLYKDREENIWIGTIRGGLLGVRKVFIKTFKDAPLTNPYGLSECTVVSLYQDTNRQLWIGTDGGGLNLFNPQKQQFEHFKQTYGKKITSISPYSEQELLLSCFNQGIFIFNKQTGKITPFKGLDAATMKKEFSYGDLVGLYTKDNEVFVFGHKIYVYDKSYKKPGNIITEDTCPERLIALQAFAYTPSETYLLGLKDVFRLTHPENKLTSVVRNNTDSEFSAAYRTSDGKIWIGTNEGLLLYNPETEALSQIETKLFTNITHLIGDGKERLWIGAQNMLFCYIIPEKRFAILGESDGFMSNNELIFTSSYNMNGPLLYMGGNRGLTCINTHIDFTQNTETQLKISDIERDGVSIINQLKNKSIDIPANHSSVSIKVIVREKDLFRKHVFRYYVSSENGRYTETYSNRFVVGKLSSGKHHISVSYDTQSGVWTNPVEILTIQVAVPWWQTTWFITSLIVLVVWIVFMFIIFNVQKKESRLKEEKIRFLINISHELRTPLTLIQAPLKRLIERKNTNIPIDEELQKIYKQTVRMKETINMVLDVRKMETGHETLHITRCQLNEWMENIAELFNMELAEKDIKLLFYPDKRIGEITFDENKCKIVLSNLIMNALKFSEPHTQIVLSTNLISDDRYRVSVTDQGMGLNHVDSQKLFTRFYQGNHNLGGSGIGLSYAKMLIEIQGGIIGAKNNVESGAVFFFELPMRILPKSKKMTSVEIQTNDTHKAVQTKEIHSDEITQIDFAKYTVLIADDEPGLLKFLHETFVPQFAQVYTATDGLKALESIRKHQPDIIISDVMMPNMDGYELCRSIKQDLKISHIPVILFTARSDEQNTIKGYKLGADAYLSKPFDLNVLLAIMANQIIRRENIRAKYLNAQGTLSDNENITFSNADEQFMIKLNKIINDQMGNPDLGIDYIIDKMAMSRTSLYDKIHQIIGIGVNDYIKRMRIDRAAFLLVNTDKSITEITDEVGFAYARNFSTTFRKLKGNTPTDYRRQNFENKKKSATNTLN